MVLPLQTSAWQLKEYSEGSSPSSSSSCSSSSSSAGAPMAATIQSSFCAGPSTIERNHQDRVRGAIRTSEGGVNSLLDSTDNETGG